MDKNRCRVPVIGHFGLCYDPTRAGSTNEVSLMDFSSIITTATKTTALNDVIADKEGEIYRLSWALGIDPDDLAADYTAPADPDTAETRLESTLADLAVVKAALAAL